MRFSHHILDTDSVERKQDFINTLQLKALFSKFNVKFPKLYMHSLDEDLDEGPLQINKTKEYEEFMSKMNNVDLSTQHSIYRFLNEFVNKEHEPYFYFHHSYVSRMNDDEIKQFLTSPRTYKVNKNVRGLSTIENIVAGLLEIENYYLIDERKIVSGNAIIDGKIISFNDIATEDEIDVSNDLIKMMNVVLGIEINLKGASEAKNKYIDMLIPYEYHKGTSIEYEKSVWETIIDEYNKVGEKIIAIVEPKALYSLLDSKYREMMVKFNAIEGIIKLPYRLNINGVQPILVILNKKKENTKVRFLDLSTYYDGDEADRELIMNSDVDKIYKNDKKVVLIDNNDLGVDHYDLSVEKIIARSKYKKLDTVSLSVLTEDIFRGTSISLRSLEEKDFEATRSDPIKCKVISLSDLENGILHSKELNEVSYRPIFSRSVVHNNDIVISAKFTTFKSALIKIDNDDLVIASGNVYVIRPNKDQIIPGYLKAFLDSPAGSELIASLSKGNSLKMIKSGELKDMPIPVADIDTQRQIADEANTAYDDVKLYHSKLEEALLRYVSAFDKFYSK